MDKQHDTQPTLGEIRRKLDNLVAYGVESGTLFTDDVPYLLTLVEQQATTIAEQQGEIERLRSGLSELVRAADDTDWDYKWASGQYNDLLTRSWELAKEPEG